MIKITSFLIAASVLFQSFSFNITDVIKVPLLLNHLEVHLEEGHSLSDFLSLHYGSESEHVNESSENHEHRELPFKHKHVDSHFQLAFGVFINSEFREKSNFKFHSNNFNYLEIAQQLVAKSYFQPPKHS